MAKNKTTQKKGLPTTKILFLHGWHSVPGGVKPTYLKDHGYEVINPNLDDHDFDVAVATASKILQPGYKYKERILRPARVAVTDPES